MTSQDTTKKMAAIPQMNEKQWARFKYDEARANMLANPTPDNCKAFADANTHLYEVEDAYRIGARIMFERAQQVLEAARGLLRV